MSQIRDNLVISPQDVFATSTTQGTDLGAYATTGDGRVFRYAKASSTALVPGTVLQANPEDTSNWENLTPTATAAGLKSITISGAPSVTANALVGGYVATTTGAGYGYIYKIASNTTGSATTSLVLTLEDAVSVALTSTSRIDLFPSPYNGVIVNPTTATSMPIGVAITTLAASSYGWIQTHGPTNITASGALTVGLGVTPSTTVAGNVVLATSATTIPSIGYAITGVAANESGLVFLEID